VVEYQRCKCLNIYKIIVIFIALLIGCTGLHLAAQFGHTSIVAFFIAKGLDVDLRDKNGMTALMWSCYRVFGYCMLVYHMINKAFEFTWEKI